VADTVVGVDFTCAPSSRKPITAAWGSTDGSVVRLHSLQTCDTLSAFDQCLLTPSPLNTTAWTGAFDFPFGLPRLFIDALASHPAAASPVCDAADLVQRMRGPEAIVAKQHFQAMVDSWGKAWGEGSRPSKLPHRQTDLAMPGITSTSPLQTRYVPVGKMYAEGFWRLLQAPIDIPLVRPLPSSACHAFEAYPGLLAHEVLAGSGPASSYKNDADNQTDPKRLLNRLTLLDRLEQGRTRLQVRLKLTPAQRDHIASDPLGDRLDAVLCMLQAAWGVRMQQQGHKLWGLPEHADPLEGWILSA
jgi:Protein of unknown function (DUF429)